MAKVKNAKRVSVNTLERVAKENVNEEIVEWNGVEVRIIKTLPLGGVLQFVDSVVKSCFYTDTGEYYPEVKNLAICSNILDTYANFTMPSNAEKQYELVYCTDAVDMVLKHINVEQLNEITKAIDAKIAYYKDVNTKGTERRLDELITQIEAMYDKIVAISEITPDELRGVVDAIGGIDEAALARAVFAEGHKGDAEDDSNQ